jgi:hypothetical protein
MVDTTTRDTSHVDELRREADIASRPSIQIFAIWLWQRSGMFCLATDYCEGGLLSLVDSSRFYEYFADCARHNAEWGDTCILAMLFIATETNISLTRTVVRKLPTLVCRVPMQVTN